MLRSDEIGELAVSVNKMADTIHENINELENYNFVLREDNSYIKEFEQTRRLMLRNITHDLKTPLAVISSQIEMLNICEEQEKKDYYYQSAMEEIGKMNKMISSVLRLTTEERELIRKNARLTDVSELIGELCKSRRAYVESRELELIAESPVILRAGMGGLYVRTTGKAGSGTLTLSAPGCESKTVDFTVALK